MNGVAIIYKSHTPAAQKQGLFLRDWLVGRVKTVQLAEAGAPLTGFGPGPDLKLSPDTEMVVVLGGDGTMLGAVRSVVSSGLAHVPILGVNLGGLGFLTALSPEELLPAMERVLAGEFASSPRLMLDARVQRDDQVIKRFTALNDVVINKAALARIVELHAVVDGRPLNTFLADGLIVSTPTGSTAYNLSAGGPICHPRLACIVVAPICSFALSNRPLLLPPDTRLAVTLGKRAQDTTLTCDGQVGLDLNPGDCITVRRAKETVRIIHSPFKDYFEILRTKLRWG